jgi:endonuclease III related protein
LLYFLNMSIKTSVLMEIYDRLSSSLGPSHWWPGDSPLEIMVGAVLTQNTAWVNVEKAVHRIKREGGLSAKVLSEVDEATLAEWIRPAGYYRLKARRLKNLMAFLMEEWGGQIHNLPNIPVEDLRRRLLTVNGIGPETADSILLYALGLPSFVVDAYTYRILMRHQMIEEEMSYEDLRNYFMERLPTDPDLYNEFHALLVRLGKDYCRKVQPRCEACPLREEDRP